IRSFCVSGLPPTPTGSVSRSSTSKTRQVSWSDVQRRTAIALITGVAAVAAAVVYAGAGAVAQAVASLRLSGLLVLVLLHMPSVILMGLAWWLASRKPSPP